jgi:hypothetical protein
MAERLAQKLARQNVASTEGAPSGPPKLTENLEIAAKIKKFREENPSYAEYLTTLPRERVENMAILRKIEANEQSERIRGATSRKLEAWLEMRPEEAQKIAEAVAKIAPDKQAGARIRMIQSAVQREALRPAQNGAGQRVGV